MLLVEAVNTFSGQYSITRGIPAEVFLMVFVFASLPQSVAERAGNATNRLLVSSLLLYSEMVTRSLESVLSYLVDAMPAEEAFSSNAGRVFLAYYPMFLRNLQLLEQSSVDAPDLRNWMESVLGNS